MTQLIFFLGAATTRNCVNLAYLPEPLYNIVLLGVATIICMFLPVVYINFSNSTNQKLKFTLIEHIDQLLGYQLIKSFHEHLELLLHSLGHSPFGDKSVNGIQNFKKIGQP